MSKKHQSMVKTHQIKRVYLAGPYSGGNIMTILGNIRQGVDQAARLIRAGHAVFCPFLDWQMAFTPDGPQLTKDQYQANSMAFLECCNVIMLLPGWKTSRGARRELKRAKEMGLAIWK